MAKQQKENKIEIQYGIKSIEELSFSLDDSVEFDIDYIDIPIKFSLDFHDKQNEVDFLLEVGYLDRRSQKEFYSIKVKNTYIILGLKSYKKKGEPTYDLPDRFMALLLGISISHTRALMSNHLRGTNCESLILPILNPSELIKNVEINTK